MSPLPRANRLIERIVAGDEHLDAAAFVAVMTENGAFRFAGNPPVMGRENVRVVVQGIFDRLTALKHTIHASWEGDATIVYEAEVEYTFRDGIVQQISYVNVLRLDGDLVADYRIYLDPTPLQGEIRSGT